MSRKVYVLVPVLLICLVILLPTVYFYLKHQVLVNQRHHLLCEVLKPDMAKDQVLSVLKQEGNFTVNEVDWPSEFFALDINFTDPALLAKYGHFSVVFIDYKYKRAVVPHGSDNPEIVCNFYGPTELPTWVP
jgi:hypothetical protein